MYIIDWNGIRECEVVDSTKKIISVIDKGHKWRFRKSEMATGLNSSYVFWKVIGEDKEKLIDRWNQLLDAEIEKKEEAIKNMKRIKK